MVEIKSQIEKMTITNPKSKKARKGKNQVVTILVGERDRISSYIKENLDRGPREDYPARG